MDLLLFCFLILLCFANFGLFFCVCCFVFVWLFGFVFVV